MTPLLRLGGRPRTWRLLAGGLFLAVFALQWAGSEPLAFWGALYAVPIVIVGRREDSVTGLLAGVVAVALAVAAALLGDVSPSAGDYIALALAFPIAGWVAGAPGELPSETTRHGLGPGAPPSVAGAPSDDREEHRREALKLVGLGTWELDLASGEIDWSAEYHDLYGVDPDVFIASRDAFQEIVHPEDRALLAAALEKITSDGTAVEIRYRIIRPSDGAERCIRSHIHCQTDASGRPVRLLGTGQDITDLVMVLSVRESEVLMLLAEGLSGEDIAERLVLSPATVRTHVQNAMGKLGAHTRGQAIATALRSREIGS